MARTFVSPIGANPLVIRSNPHTFGASLGKIGPKEKAERVYDGQSMETVNEKVWMKVAHGGVTGWVLLCIGEKRMAQIETV